MVLNLRLLARQACQTAAGCFVSCVFNINSWCAAKDQIMMSVCVCVCVCHPHPESLESCQSVWQSLLLAGGQLCYMSPPLLLFLLKHRVRAPL